MRDVVVVADDLTGAADCAVAFVSAGLSTFVVVREGAQAPAAQAVAVDTDTRALDAGAAEARTHAAALAACRERPRALYRKLDSTLRGHVGAELAAMLRAVREAEGAPALAIFAPAFPALGRTTEGGRVVVKGVPLDRTEAWRDSGTPGSAVPAEMLSVAGLRAAVVSLADVRGGRLAQALERAAATHDVAICDAAEETDLAAIAAAGAQLSRRVVWTGSGGLARHLPRALGLRGSGAAVEPPRRKGPVLVVAGSRSSIAREQARRLAEQPGVVRVELDPRAVLDGRPAPELDRALASGADVVAVLGETSVGLDRGPELAAAVGRLVAPHVERLAGVAATGGDVARGLFAGIDAGGLHLLGEVEAGVPLGVTDTIPPLLVATKAGAFGAPETLVRCRSALRERAGGS